MNELAAETGRRASERARWKFFCTQSVVWGRSGPGRPYMKPGQAGPARVHGGTGTRGEGCRGTRAAVGNGSKDSGLMSDSVSS